MVVHFAGSSLLRLSFSICTGHASYLFFFLLAFYHIMFYFLPYIHRSVGLLPSVAYSNWFIRLPVQLTVYNGVLGDKNETIFNKKQTTTQPVAVLVATQSQHYEGKAALYKVPQWRKMKLLLLRGEGVIMGLKSLKKNDLKNLMKDTKWTSHLCAVLPWQTGRRLDAGWRRGRDGLRPASGTCLELSSSSPQTPLKIGQPRPSSQTSLAVAGDEERWKRRRKRVRSRAENVNEVFLIWKRGQ